MYAEAHVSGEDEGADIEGSPVRMRHPVFVDFHKRLDRLYKIFRGDFRHAHAVTGVPHPIPVAVRAENLDHVVRRAIGFQALEQFLRVVEDHAGGVQFKGRIGDNPGIVPALFRVIVHQEHMIGELFAKAQSGFIGRAGFRRVCFHNFNIQHTCLLLLRFFSGISPLKRGDRDKAIVFYTPCHAGSQEKFSICL